MTDIRSNYYLRDRLMTEVRCKICRNTFGDANIDTCAEGRDDEHTFVIDKSTVPKELPLAEIIQAIKFLFGAWMADSWRKQLSTEYWGVCSDYD